MQKRLWILSIPSPERGEGLHVGIIMPMLEGTSQRALYNLRVQPSPSVHNVCHLYQTTYQYTLVRSTCIDQRYTAMNSAICRCLGVHGYACTTHFILGTLVSDSAAQSVHAICARLSCPQHALVPLDACTINPGASALLAIVRPVLCVCRPLSANVI